MRTLLLPPVLAILLLTVFRPLQSQVNDTVEVKSLLKEVRKKYSTDKELTPADSLKLNKALLISQRLNYVSGEAQYYDILGVHERNISNYAKSLELHRKAYQLVENTNLYKEQTIILNNIGVVYRRLSDYDNAASYHIKALEIAEQNNDRTSVSISLNSLGNIFIEEKKYDKALEYFRNALKNEIEASNDLGIAINYNNIGSVYEMKNDYAKAIEYFNKSLQTNQKITSNKGIGICYLSLGEIYLKTGKLKEAREYIEKAYELNIRLKDKIYTSTTYIDLGKLNVLEKKYSEALINFRKGLKLSLSISSKLAIENAYAELADVFEKTGRYDSAIYYLKLNVKYRDSILNEESARDLNLKQVLYETGKKDKEIELLKYKQQVKDKKQKFVVISLISGCLVLLVLVILIYNSYRLKRIANRNLINYNADIEEKNRILTLQKEEILTQHDEIENKSILLQQAFETIKIKNNNITDNIRYALQIQSAMLPEHSTLRNHLPDSFIFYQPKDIVSGDFYWITRKNYKTVITIADCTGHGVTGAFMSILGISLLNEIVQERGITEPNLILNSMRDKLVDTLQQGNSFSESREGIHMVVCTFNEDFTNMQFSGAINSIYLIRENQILQFKGDKMPVSISPEMENYSITEIPLEPKDMIYMYTDGYYGQFGGLEDKKFSVFRFRNLLQKISHLELNDQQNIIERTFLSWKGKTEQVDDILIMGIRI